MKNLTKNEKKQFLIDVAIDQFHKNGMSKTTIVNITKEANIGKSTFYEYFSSKEDVLNQWFIDLVQNFSSLESELNNQQSNKEKLLFLINFSCNSEYTDERFISMFVEFWRLSFSEKNKESLRLINDFYVQFSIQIESYIQDGVKNKEFKKCDTKKVASTIIALIDGLWIQYILNRDDFSLAEYSNYAIKTILKGIEYE